MPDNPSRPYSFARRRRLRFDYHNASCSYFVTIRALSGSPFEDERLAQAVVDSLKYLREKRGIRIYAYCLMPNHLHVLLQLGSEKQFLGTILSTFKSFTTRASWELGLSGPLWQERFYDHIVDDPREARDVVIYILANPERKGLVRPGRGISLGRTTRSVLRRKAALQPTTALA